MFYKKGAHSYRFKTIGLIITLFFFIDCAPLVSQKSITQEVQPTAKQVIDSIVAFQGFEWEVQHFGTLKCQPEEIGIYLQQLTSKEFIKKYRDHEYYSAKEYQESQYWFNSIEVCLTLMQNFPVSQNANILINCVSKLEFNPYLARKAILALGQLKAAKKYIEQLTLSENEVFRISAIEAQTLCLISENNYSEIEVRYRQYKSNFDRIWNGKQIVTYKLISDINALLQNRKWLLERKTLEAQIQLLLVHLYIIHVPGASILLEDTLMSKAALFELKKLLDSNRSQVLAVLRKMADEERKLPDSSRYPSALYMMKDFGLPMTEAETIELKGNFPISFDKWKPLFIPPICQEIENP